MRHRFENRSQDEREALADAIDRCFGKTVVPDFFVDQAEDEIRRRMEYDEAMRQGTLGRAA